MNFLGKKMNSVYKPPWDLLQVVQLKQYGKIKYWEGYAISPLPLQWPGRKQAFPAPSAQFYHCRSCCSCYTQPMGTAVGALQQTCSVRTAAAVISGSFFVFANLPFLKLEIPVHLYSHILNCAGLIDIKLVSTNKPTLSHKHPVRRWHVQNPSLLKLCW